MIVVCEPQCTGTSHEKVNSGFLTLVRRAYPGEVIRFYADRSHVENLQQILALDGVSVEPLEHRDLDVRDANSVSGVVSYQRQFKRMLRDAEADGCREILFLSGNPMLLHLLKRLNTELRLRLAFVLHADFEDVGNAQFADVHGTAVPEPTLRQKLGMIELRELPAKTANYVKARVAARYARIWKERFRTREQLLWRAGDDYHYIALAPHVAVNAAEYLDLSKVHLHVVEMPINFAPQKPVPANDHLKFATFGYGDPASLRAVVDHLAELRPERDYEIRIIGMDNRTLENIPHVSCPSPGKALPRAEMERYAEDIDAFLILYGRDRYRLSCSGSILEAISYVKPVIHIGNACVEAFDRAERPIGFRCDDLAAAAALMKRMIDDPAAYRNTLQERRNNILSLRAELAMDKLAPKLRAALGREARV
jgi:hypothetical protein